MNFCVTEFAPSSLLSRLKLFLAQRFDNIAKTHFLAFKVRPDAD